MAPCTVELAQAGVALLPLISRRAPGRPKPGALTGQPKCTCSAKRCLHFD